MYSIEMMDGSREKRERRRVLDEICARQTGLLATNYPGPLGRDFIRELHRRRPELSIALVTNSSFKRDVPGDSLDGIKKIRGDVFDVMQSYAAPIVDIDLYGGLSREHMRKLQTAPYWEKILLTCTNVFRHRTKKPFLKRGEDLAGVMEQVCLEAGFQPPMMPQFPYPRPNKNAILGLLDKRGPRYWTFYLQR